MAPMSVTEIRKNLPETINRVVYGGQRVIISRNGKEAAALVSLEDLKLLEDLEDQLDVEEARRRLAEEKPVPYEKARKTAGLK